MFGGEVQGLDIALHYEHGNYIKIVYKKFGDKDIGPCL